jgi:uncharacterized membrane protein AbrB (regulator of aidB expression)
LVRVLLAVSIVGIVVSRLGSKDDSEKPASDEGDGQDSAPAGQTGIAEDLNSLGIAAPWGIVGGVAGLISTVPAAGIIGALVGTTAFQLIADRSVPTTKYQYGVQMLSGGVIGLEISGRFFSELFMLAVAGALIICVQMVLWFAASWLLARLFSYDVPTAALASSPGG